MQAVSAPEKERGLRFVKRSCPAAAYLSAPFPEMAVTELNLGNFDRVLRITAGFALVGAAAAGTLGSWAYLGVIPIATGLVAWCPLYRVIGVRSTAR